MREPFRSKARLSPWRSILDSGLKSSSGGFRVGDCSCSRPGSNKANPCWQNKGWGTAEASSLSAMALPATGPRPRCPHGDSDVGVESHPPFSYRTLGTETKTPVVPRSSRTQTRCTMRPGDRPPGRYEYARGGQWNYPRGARPPPRMPFGPGHPGHRGFGAPNPYGHFPQGYPGASQLVLAGFLVLEGGGLTSDDIALLLRTRKGAPMGPGPRMGHMPRRDMPPGTPRGAFCVCPCTRCRRSHSPAD
eukprot:scaffold576_cov260-Pinguiococcus_pyrenoidosus.AAC.13